MLLALHLLANATFGQQRSDSLEESRMNALSQQAANSFISEFRARYLAVELNAPCKIHLRASSGKSLKLQGHFYRSMKESDRQLDMVLTGESGTTKSWKGTFTPPNIIHECNGNTEEFHEGNFSDPLFEGYSLSLEDLKLNITHLPDSDFSYLGVNMKKGRRCQTYSINNFKNALTVIMHIDAIGKFPIIVDFLKQGSLVKRFEVESFHRKTRQLKSFIIIDKVNNNTSTVRLLSIPM